MWLISKALYESLHSSQEREVESLEESSSDGKPSAQSSGSHTQLAYLPPDKMTAFSRLSRFGMTFAPLTEDRGEELLTLYRAAFPVKPIPQRLEDAIQRTIFGRRCGESWQMSLPGTSLPKTSAELRLTKRRTTLNRWVTLPDALKFQRKTWVLTTFGPDVGYLHTPTTMANYTAKSMQKWSSCRTWVQVFGTVTPENSEWLMGWPLGWTDLKPLEMDKSHSAPQQPGDI
jgi:hypothetical protein